MNVEIVQKRLWEQSQQHRKHRESDTPLFPVDGYEGRIRNLMDLMHQPQWIATACDRVLKRSRVEKHPESRMPGNWHVRFGVGAGGETPPAYTTWVGNGPGPPGLSMRPGVAGDTSQPPH
jgi:hypothetical protein